MTGSRTATVEGHWDRIYREKGEGERSWTQREPQPSLELLEEAGLREGARVLDVGGGTSRLVDRLLDRGLRPGVLEISEGAITATRERLGERTGPVEWIHGSVLDYRAAEPWDAWHDRATFHFLVQPDDRARYLSTLRASLTDGGVLVLATFSERGPERCSGLPVRGYDAESMAAELGDDFAAERFVEEDHRTPWGEAQPFVYGRFRRVGGPLARYRVPTGPQTKGGA